MSKRPQTSFLLPQTAVGAGFISRFDPNCADKVIADMRTGLSLEQSLSRYYVGRTTEQLRSDISLCERLLSLPDYSEKDVQQLRLRLAKSELETRLGQAKLLKQPLTLFQIEGGVAA